MSSHLMGTTLPTVVGMYVVKDTTETLMGPKKHGKKRAKTHKPKARKPKVHKGPRGGKYIMRKGRRVYI